MDKHKQRILALDPVCGTEVVPGAQDVSLIYRGIVYRFCSPHCRDRFQATPALYTGARRSEDILPMPKRRRLRCTAGAAENLRHAEQALRALKGIEAVAIGADNLTIAYDLRIVTLSQIEKVLAESGVQLRGGLHSWRRALWRFEESNESENAARAGGGACCSRPPPRLR